MNISPFAQKITKEEVARLPQIAFTGEVITIDKMPQIANAMHYLNQQDTVGVDTETRPSFQRGEHHPTALIQIATEERCYLFRLNKIGMPQVLADFFANPNITKVGLAFKDDLIGLRRQRPFSPKSCEDIQKIAPQYGILEMGLQKMFAIVFGKKVNKSQQLTNWENVFLTPEQERYAATDAWATLLIYKRLKETQPLPAEVVQALLDTERAAQLALNPNHQTIDTQPKTKRTSDE